MPNTIDTEKRRDPPKNADRSDNIPNPQFDKPKEVDAGDRVKGGKGTEGTENKTSGPKRVDAKGEDQKEGTTGTTKTNSTKKGHKTREDDSDKRAHDEERDDPVGVDTRHQTVSPSAAEH